MSDTLDYRQEPVLSITGMRAHYLRYNQVCVFSHAGVRRGTQPIMQKFELTMCGHQLEELTPRLDLGVGGCLYLATLLLKITDDVLTMEGRVLHDQDGHPEQGQPLFEDYRLR